MNLAEDKQILEGIYGAKEVVTDYSTYEVLTYLMAKSDRDKYIEEEAHVFNNQIVMFEKFTPSVSLKSIDKIKLHQKKKH